MLALTLPGQELSYYREVLTSGWELAKKKAKPSTVSGDESAARFIINHKQMQRSTNFIFSIFMTGINIQLGLTYFLGQCHIVSHEWPSPNLQLTLCGGERVVHE